MRDFMVFEEHVLPAWRRSGLTRGPDVWYEQPIGYFSNAATIRGPREQIEIPGGSTNLDFELAVAAVVGRQADRQAGRHARSPPNRPPATSPASSYSVTGPRAICSFARWTDGSARSRYGHTFSRPASSASMCAPCVLAVVVV